jgi:hypothetical protein
MLATSIDGAEPSGILKGVMASRRSAVGIGHECSTMTAADERPDQRRDPAPECTSDRLEDRYQRAE